MKHTMIRDLLYYMQNTSEWKKKTVCYLFFMTGILNHIFGT